MEMKSHMTVGVLLKIYRFSILNRSNFETLTVIFWSMLRKMKDKLEICDGSRYPGIPCEQIPSSTMMEICFRVIHKNLALKFEKVHQYKQSNFTRYSC